MGLSPFRLTWTNNPVSHFIGMCSNHAGIVQKMSGTATMFLSECGVLHFIVDSVFLLMYITYLTFGTLI